jgi:hypothetical protein
MDRHHCRFEQWLEGEAASGRGEQAEFRSVYDLHRAFHRHADSILDRKTRNGGAAAEDLPGLRALRDDLLEKIHHLTQTL